MEYKYIPKTKEELISAIEKEIDLQGDNADLNSIDTSAITDMRDLFAKISPDYDENGTSKFNGDISQWDVSNVKDMCYMFSKSMFNEDISDWSITQDSKNSRL